MRDFNEHEQMNRKSLFRKVKWQIPEDLASIKQSQKEYKAKSENKSEVKVIDGRTFAYNLDIGIKWDPEPTNPFTFNNKELKDLNPNGSQVFDQDHWDCNIKYDENNARLFIDDVKINTTMHGMPHSLPVFQSIHFEDIVIAFDIDGTMVEKSLDFEYSGILPSTTREYYGYQGSYNRDEKYQAGLSQFTTYTFYCAEIIITLEVEYSFTFMYWICK